MNIFHFKYFISLLAMQRYLLMSFICNKKLDDAKNICRSQIIRDTKFQENRFINKKQQQYF